MQQEFKEGRHYYGERVGFMEKVELKEKKVQLCCLFPFLLFESVNLHFVWLHTPCSERGLWKYLHWYWGYLALFVAEILLCYWRYSRSGRSENRSVASDRFLWLSKDTCGSLTGPADTSVLMPWIFLTFMRWLERIYWCCTANITENANVCGGR